jgi:putative glutathione S-transferase
MGMLVDGQWQTELQKNDERDKAFVRPPSVFRDAVTAEPGARYFAEPDRYRLYVSYACPWAHRVLLVRALKGLENVFPITVVDAFMGEGGWSLGEHHLHEVYTKANPRYTGRVTVPVLWDDRHGTIVSNESAEIIRMLDTAFDKLATRPCPPLYAGLLPALREEIDALNHRIYETVNNGVYRAGFAGSQQAYDQAVTALFETLDALEERLASRTWLVGDAISEADVRLFPTLLRFDVVYFAHFKCNVRRITDYPNLWRYARQIYQLPHVADTVNFSHIKEHYYRSHPQINPTRIVPKGPAIDWSATD